MIEARGEKTFIRTYTGQKFWPLEPRACEVHIEDIARALANICRFTGHCNRFYSVADHSLRVSRLAETKASKYAVHFRGFGVEQRRLRHVREVALWGLLHDASEAYLCDMPSPLKHSPGMGPIYKQYEAKLMEVIASRFELRPDEPAVVKDADRILLNTEMRDLMNNAAFGGEVLPEPIWPLTSSQAETNFLFRFHELTTAREVDRLRTCALVHE